MSHDAPGPRDTIVTRFLGIVLGVSLMFAFVAIAHNMDWHPVVGGLLTGLSGAILGASGSSFQGPYTTAILGWCGSTNFVLGILMFFGFSPNSWMFG